MALLHLNRILVSTYLLVSFILFLRDCNILEIEYYFIFFWVPADISEGGGKEQVEAQPARRGRGRKQ